MNLAFQWQELRRAITMWHKDEEVQRHFTELLDRLCTLERMGDYGSTLVFISDNLEDDVLFAMDGKLSYAPEHQTDFDVEMGVKMALKKRLPKIIRQ